MKVLVKARILKIWILIKGEIQLIQKVPSASVGFQFIKMFNLTVHSLQLGIRDSGFDLGITYSHYFRLKIFPGSIKA